MVKRKQDKMAKRSSGKRSSNRVAQKASAEAKLSAALERAYAIKPGDKMTVIFGRVEKEMGSAQFLVVTGKDRKVNATPLGVFTKKSCPITAGQIVMMEPTEHAHQTHLIIARLDTKKDVKALMRAGVIPKDIFETSEMEDAADDLFDWDGAEDSDAESADEETQQEKHAWKSRGKTYIKKKKAPPASGGGGAAGGTVLKEAVAATVYAEEAADDSDEGVKKVRRRKVAGVAAAAPPTAPEATPVKTAPTPGDDEMDIWAGVKEEATFIQREVPACWEDDDALNIDEI